MTKTQRLENLIQQINQLQAEASRHKMVRVSWLSRNLTKIIENMQPVLEPAPRRTPRPVSLLRFLARDGLQRNCDLIAMDAHLHFVPGCGQLIRSNGGRSLDYAREAAEEAGYLPAGSDINTLLDAIAEELHGRPVYSEHDMGAVLENELAAHAEAERLRHGAIDAGLAMECAQ